MAYYTTETCGYVNDNYVTDGCKNDYDQVRLSMQWMLEKLIKFQLLQKQD